MAAVTTPTETGGGGSTKKTTNAESNTAKKEYTVAAQLEAAKQSGAYDVATQKAKEGKQSALVLTDLPAKTTISSGDVANAYIQQKADTKQARKQNVLLKQEDTSKNAAVVSTPDTGNGDGGGTPATTGYTGANSSGTSGSSVAASTTHTSNVQAVETPKLDEASSNYLLEQYNNLDTFKQEMNDLVNTKTAELIDLSNQKVDAATKQQILALSNALDESKAQYAQTRALLQYNKAQTGDNIRLANAAAGNKGGLGNTEYGTTVSQYDQALYEIDLEQINLENQTQQAIAEANATGDYQKLEYQLALAQSAYEQLVNIAQSVQESKMSAASSLDNYNEGIREYNAEYALQVMQIEQNAVLNKISSGITVTAEDMAKFGLSGTDAQTAADNINASQGVERQILQEQLKAYQNSNTASTSSGGSYSSGTGSSATTSSNGTMFADNFPNVVAQQIELAMDSSDGLTVTHADGTTSKIHWGVADGAISGDLRAGDTCYNNQYVWNGNQWVLASDYQSSGGEETIAPTNIAYTDAQNEAYQKYVDMYMSFLNKYGQEAMSKGLSVDPTIYMTQAEKNKLGELYLASGR